MDLIADEDAANERVRELLRDQQLGPARKLLQDQLRVARSDGASWAQLANLERRCAKRRRKGATSASATNCASSVLASEADGASNTCDADTAMRFAHVQHLGIKEPQGSLEDDLQGLLTRHKFLNRVIRWIA